MEHRLTALLGAQRALIGAVGPNLVAGCIQVENGVVTATWYVTPELSEGEREDLLAAGGMIIGDFDDETIEENFVEVRDPDQPLPCIGEWVFMRRAS